MEVVMLSCLDNGLLTSVWNKNSWYQTVTLLCMHHQVRKKGLERQWSLHAEKKTFHTIEFTWLSLLEKHETTSVWCMGFLSPFTTGKVQQANVRIPFIIYELPITSLGCEDINLEWLKTNVSYTRLSHFCLLIPPCQSRWPFALASLRVLYTPPFGDR